VAQIFWVRDGTQSDKRSSKAHQVPMALVLEKLASYDRKYSAVPITVNPEKGPAKWQDQFRHVILRVDADETNASYPDAGYYLIRLLTPAACREILRL
jgi:hypothetical protein